MKFAEVAENVKQLVENPPDQDEFIYALLLAYGTPKATIARMKSGQTLSKEPGDVLLKKKVWFKNVGQASSLSRQGPQDAGDTNAVSQASSLPSEKPSDIGQAGSLSHFAIIEEMKASKAAKTNDPRFLIVTDFKRILAVDRKKNDSLDIKFGELEFNFAFFLPWAGMEKTKLSNENPADVKAAEKMAKLFDAIKQDNPDYMRHDAHAMNVFLGRLLFCLFAEDTGIFPENSVCNAIASHTDEDGSDLDAFFKQLFDWLDTSDKERGIHREGAQGTQKNKVGQASSLSADEESLRSVRSFAVKSLPYVNGGLFRDHYDIPQFSAKSRRMLIEAGTLTWAEINPDIFGSMFQAVIDPEERHNLGQHYTSVTNIMKVIEPLFLNDFKEELERARNLSQKNVRTKALNELHDRIAKVKIFDPACGSGNFLIIAYKELRKLEMELFEAMNAFPVSRITVDQFYGIEIADFACETATLSLWLAEHQMNLEYQKRFKQSLTSLPLKDGAHIVCGNACRIDWEIVCPKNEGDEIYILGNPPYLGFKMQSKEHKADIEATFNNMNGHKKLDYITCWFYMAAKYIRSSNAKFAFVSTNSICQGEHVSLLWPHIFSQELEIGFAHQVFKWTNSARGNAGVSCIVVGVQKKSSSSKWLYNNGVKRSVQFINAYLSPRGDVIVYKRSKPISNLPPMLLGNMPKDDGNFILSTTEKDQLIAEYPAAAAFVRKLIGANEMMAGLVRWCIWITEENKNTAILIPPIRVRIEKVRQFRLNSTDEAAKKMGLTPYKFREQHEAKRLSLIIPTVTSERRDYIPMEFLEPQTVIVAPNNAIYDPDSWVFGIISSLMHMSWIRATCGMLETRIRYSSALCYNNFPIPDLTEGQKQTITMHVGNVLEEREKHPEKTMAQLYDPDKMPAGLREAHHQLDLAVDRIYRSKPFASDEERLEHLFKLYEEMTQKEKLI
jgi:hypothetical protein